MKKMLFMINKCESECNELNSIGIDKISFDARDENQCLRFDNKVYLIQIDNFCTFSNFCWNNRQLCIVNSQRNKI